MAIVLTKKTVKLAGIAVIVIGAIAGTYLVATPLVNSYQSQQEDISTSNSQLEIQKASLDSLRIAKENYPEVQKIDQELRSQFPDLAQTQELLNTIVAGLTSSGLNENNISSVEFKAPNKTTATAPAIKDTTTTPTTPQTNTNPGDKTISTSGNVGEFATVEVSLSINGNPDSLKKFLDYMNNAERAFIITKFSISKAASKDSPDSKNLSLTAKVFIYPAIDTPNAIKTETNNGTTGTTPTPAPSASPSVPPVTTTPSPSSSGTPPVNPTSTPSPSPSP